jgi:molybdopterin-guanine dinucleotide biosynthesis protein A
VRAGVAILAGGEATRFPGKLSLPAGDAPLLLRVARNVALGREAVVAAKGSFEPELDARLELPLVIDRRPGRGPLAGFLSALAVLRAPRVFAIAGDAPLIERDFLEQLEAAWRDGDEALVPVHRVDGRDQVEPLCALYARSAVLREGPRVLRDEGGSLRALLRRIRTRLFRVDEAFFLRSVNTAAEYAALRSHLARETA